MTKPQSQRLCDCGSGILPRNCCGSAGTKRRRRVARISVDGMQRFSSLTPQLERAVDNLASSPELFPVVVDLTARRVEFVKLSRQSYSDATFVDGERAPGTQAVETDLGWLNHLLRDARFRPAPVIFQTAFCGSTLLTRLLDAHFHCFPIREPDALMTALTCLKLPEIPGSSEQASFETCLKLLSRRFRDDEPAVIKANDSATGLIELICELGMNWPRLFLYVPADEFILSCLKSPLRRDWIVRKVRSLAPLIPAALNFHGRLDIGERSFGRLAAVYWSYQAALYLRARQNNDQFLRSLDFNELLAVPDKVLDALEQFFSLRRRQDVDSPTVTREIMGRHAKDQDAAYSAVLRDEELEAQRIRHQAQLDDGMTMAARLTDEQYLRAPLPDGLLE